MRDMRHGIIGWLWHRRDSARMAFVFRVVTMGMGMFLSLYWIRLFTATLGAEIYGLFISFIAVTRLWTLGEAGLGSAVALLSIPLLAQGRREELLRFVAAARTLFLVLGVLFAGGVFVLSPWLPSWLGFRPPPGAGSLTALFMLGAVGIGAGILGSYFSNLNYALGNVAWAVLPLFVLLQLAFATQALFAISHSPLWMQYLPHVGFALLAIWIGWLSIKWLDPALSALRPIAIDKAIFKRLLSSGFWIYLSSLGNLVFTTTSQLVINAGFGAEIVPLYVFNYKIPEMAYGIVSAAGLVAFSKIARLVNSPVQSERENGHHLFTYLHRLQLWAMMCVSSVYLFFNNTFIDWWLGTGYRVPIYLQLAFAANLVFAAAGDAAIRGISMFSEKNLPYFGGAIFGMGMLNLALSLVSMKFESLTGIAVSSVIAQVGLNYMLMKRLCRDQNWTSGEFLRRTLLHPLIFVLVLAALRLFLPINTLLQQVSVGIAALVLLAVHFRLLNLRPQHISAEFKQLRALIREPVIIREQAL